MLNLRRRGRSVVVGGVLAGAIAASMTLTAPAGAQTTKSANNLIIGSGSSTSYNVMQAMDLLFNNSLGCYMTQPAGTTQTYNFSCASNNEGEQVGEGYTENPINDIAVEEPALGSSAGIQQIEYGGPGNDGSTPHNPTAPVNFARSSRQYKSTDYPGLNFVGYAADGVSWVTWPVHGGKDTPSFGVTDLSQAQLKGIWGGTITNWDQVGGTAGNICVYTAQLSSGTESTWASGLGYSSPTTLNAYVNSLTTAPKGCKTPKGISYADSHTLPENQTYPVIKVGDEANAIYFFSYGKYQVLCNSKPVSSLCDNGIKSDIPTVGEINGIPENPSTILGTGGEQFPIVRDIYNVYSNGSFSPSLNAQYGFPAATAATINYVSEIGFICKGQLDASNAKVINPSTSNWYQTDIDDVISSQGFVPLPLQTTEDINTVDTPASAVLAADGDTKYSPNDPITGSTTAANEAISDPTGYCQVWTTDGNAAP
jgi:ABC-type phosphate transport system substrate-binding protein